MSTDDITTIADALGSVLGRDFRGGLYEYLTADLHDAVDAGAYPVLSGLDRAGAVSAAGLGHLVGLDRSVVSRRASRLTAAGLVSSAPDPDDARASLLTLSPAGVRLVGVMRARLADALEQRLEAWPAADRRDFARLLKCFALAGPLQPPHRSGRR
ncbi:MarR family winged helix-turn-helix transcriptional regulator [Kineosporia mesophila]|uniref:MarR family winged helix-turn-helix transcriptional regulator n=1 Tax=Kineosporia mesophila TaxID=566012 RepID=UPI001E48E328|nr:MarR family winged helix-turn-helix transcriptional regulator [Kineosporia mesophila]